MVDYDLEYRELYVYITIIVNDIAISEKWVYI